jgi:hypothetical protein
MGSFPEGGPPPPSLPRSAWHGPLRYSASSGSVRGPRSVPDGVPARSVGTSLSVNCIIYMDFGNGFVPRGRPSLATRSEVSGPRGQDIGRPAAGGLLNIRFVRRGENVEHSVRSASGVDRALRFRLWRRVVVRGHHRGVCGGCPVARPVGRFFGKRPGLVRAWRAYLVGRPGATLGRRAGVGGTDGRRA